MQLLLHGTIADQAQVNGDIWPFIMQAAHCAKQRIEPFLLVQATYVNESRGNLKRIITFDLEVGHVYAVGDFGDLMLRNTGGAKLAYHLLV